MRRSLVAAALLLAAAVQAQPLPQQAQPPSEAPPPPPLRLEGLVPLDVARSPGVRWGLDPQSLQVTPDGLVRYVAIAQSDSGAVNAFYETLNCVTAEVKVQARRGRDGDWVRAGESQAWRSLQDGAATRHSLAMARSGACNGPMANGSAAQILRELRRNSTGRYLNQSL